MDAYVRSPPRPILSPTLTTYCKHSAQVHISLVGGDHIRVTWITKDAHVPSVVEYGISPGEYTSSARGDRASSYSYLFYTSGNIHHVVIGPLEANTFYYYRCAGHDREYILKTPPSQFPIAFSLVGDLGQTGWTISTLQHIQASDHDVFLLPGDLSYADNNQLLWDSFGSLVEPLASSRPWMVTEGNHEIETIPIVMNDAFKSYKARWRMPYEESRSNSNLYYSFEVAGVHVVMLGSYAEFGMDSDQYKWLQARLYNNQTDPRGPVYITIGDGGNQEGLALSFNEPKSELSLFREASFGHGELRIYSATQAHWSWHRNQDDESVIADEVWINCLSSSTDICAYQSRQLQENPSCDLVNEILLVI